ncbi:Uncharacterised protein [Mycobacteroides abscessus subsp. abscessus]|nr:Uncharacterised protein [Mycobacteroides abscessus subsp. abscessus]
MADDVGVSREVVAAIVRTAAGRFSEPACQICRPNPAIAIPMSLAASQAQAVCHAFAHEHLVAAGVLLAQWIRANA